MSRQRFPCRNQDGHNERSGSQQGLVRSRDFRSRQKTIVSRQDFMGLCRDRVFYVVTEFDQDKRVSCLDKVFCVATRCGQDKGALCCDKAICVMTEFC